MYKRYVAGVGTVIERVNDLLRYNVILERLDTAPLSYIVLGYKGLLEIVGSTSETVFIVLRRNDRPVVLRYR